MSPGYCLPVGGGWPVCLLSFFHLVIFLWQTPNFEFEFSVRYSVEQGALLLAQKVVLRERDPTMSWQFSPLQFTENRISRDSFSLEDLLSIPTGDATEGYE